MSRLLLIFIVLTLPLFIDRTSSTSTKVNLTIVALDSDFEVNVNETFNVTCSDVCGFLHFKAIAYKELDGFLGLTKLETKWYKAYDENLKADLNFKTSSTGKVDCKLCPGDNCNSGPIVLTMYVTPHVSGKYFFFCYNEEYNPTIYSMKKGTVIGPSIVSSSLSLAPTSTSSLVTESSSTASTDPSSDCVKETVTFYTSLSSLTSTSIPRSQPSSSPLLLSTSHISSPVSPTNSMVTPHRPSSEPSLLSLIISTAVTPPVTSTYTSYRTSTSPETHTIISRHSEEMVIGVSSVGFIIVLAVVGLLVIVIGCRTAKKLRQPAITSAGTLGNNSAPDVVPI